MAFQLPETNQTFPDLGFTGEKIENMNVSKLTTGTIASQRITLGITQNTAGDVYIAGGTFSAAAWTATNGFILGLDDSDGNREKFFVGNAASSMDWNVTTADTLTVTGTIVAAAGFIGGWTITAGFIYDLTSGTPTVAPNNGVVMDSGNAALITYEGTAERARMGYLSAGVYGFRAFATNGTTVVFEVSDTRQFIAGWTFTDALLTNVAGGNTTSISSGATSFLSGPTGAPTFSVTAAGALTSTSGAIGGWNISATTLRSGATDAASNVLIDSANSLLRLGPTTGAFITLDGANQRMRSSTYTTGVSGFTVEPNLVEAQNIIARGTLSGSVFRYDVISATGGRQVIANADALSTAMTALDASTLTVRGNATFAVNDILVIRAQSSGGIQEEYLRVTGIGAAPTYTVTRDLLGTYAADTNPAWAAGTAVVQHGESDGAAAFSGGWLDLVGEASTGNFPRVSVFSRTGVGATAFTERVRMGNLNGYLGYVADTYGFGVGSSAGTDANITIDPTNGIRIRNGTTNVITLNNAGNVTVNTITATAGTIAAFTIGGTTISATNLTLTSGAANTANITVGTGATAGGINSAAAGGDIIFWGGSAFADRATAPFRVTAAGAITATSGTIAGFTINGATSFTQGNLLIQSTAERILVGAATAPLTGTGIFIGEDGTASNFYDFRAGDPAGDYIQWDHSAGTLTVSGSITVTSLPNLPPDDDLAGYWAFDEGSLTEAKNSRLSGINGTITSGTYVNGISGTALDFDGASGQVAIADDATNQVIWDGGGSISVWINPDSDGEADAGKIVSKGWTLGVSDELAGFVRVDFSHGFSVQLGAWRTDRTIPINAWTHVVIVYNASAVGNDPVFYFNGALVTTNETQAPIGVRTTDVGTGIQIGNNVGAPGTQTFDGTIDEVRMYYSSLTARQVRALFLNPSGNQTTNIGGTITAATLQTATSGQRTVMNSDSLIGYDASANVLFRLNNAADTTAILDLRVSAINRRAAYYECTNAAATANIFQIAASGGEQSAFRLDQSGNNLVNGRTVVWTGNSTAGGRVATDPFAEFSLTGSGRLLQLTCGSAVTGQALFINADQNTNISGFYVDRDGNSASRIWAAQVDSDNVGAGGVGGIDFGAFSTTEPLFGIPTDATDPTGGGGAATGRIAVVDGGGVTRYLAYY